MFNRLNKSQLPQSN